MPPSPRYTVRLPAALDALVQARVQAGTPFAALIREALSAYLADTVPTGVPTPADSADTVQHLAQQVVDLVRRVEALEHVRTDRRHTADRRADMAPTHRRHPADSPPTAPAASGGRQPAAHKAEVLARVANWQREGLTIQAMAQRLNDAGVPTLSGQGQWSYATLSKAVSREKRKKE